MGFMGKAGLITSAGMLLAGVILFSIGAANGGVEQVQAMAENGELSIGGRNFRSAQTTAIEAVDEGFERADTILEEVAIYGDYGYEYEYKMDEGVTELAKKDEIKKLEIDWEASINGNLCIVFTDYDYFSATDGSFSYKINGDTIKLSQKSNIRYAGNDTILYIPSDWKGKEIELSVGAGSVYADQLRAEKISIEIGGGYMQCELLESKEMDVEIGAGSFELYDFQTEDMKLEIGVGSASMFGEIIGDLYAQCGIGSLYMELEGEESDHNYKVSSVGSLRIGNVERSGFGNNYQINNNVSSNFDIECGLGIVAIDFNEQRE